MLRSLYSWTLSMAGHRRAPAALGAVSFTESSFFPIPADVLFVPMCLSKPDKAMSYALIATVMSVLGGVFGWLIGVYAFELIAAPLLEAMGKMEAFERLSGNAGTQAILLMLVTSGLTHIPPMKVVTILSGVLGFDLVLFIISAIIARGGRFYGLAWLLKTYGAGIATFIERRLALVAIVVVVIAVVAFFFLRGH